MTDMKTYDFMLQLQTYLRRTNILAEKFGQQEIAIGKSIFNIKNTLPKETFDELFAPLANLFNERVELMNQIREANNDFEELLKNYYEQYRGTLQ